MVKIPSFDELTLDPDGPIGNAWGLFGPLDELGTLNFLTPETVVHAAQEIHDGTRISLDWPLSKISHPSFGRAAFEQRIVRKGPAEAHFSVNDDILHFNTQCSSQWDGFRHYGHQKSKRYFNGHTQEDLETTEKIGTAAWVDRGGIVGRGVLIDWASWATQRGIPIEPFKSTAIALADLQHIVQEQNIHFHPGDILFLRTGYAAAYNKLSVAQEKEIAQRSSPDFIGLEATAAMLRWLWEMRFAAVASDCPSFERAPIAGPHHDPDHMLHQWLLAGWGMPIGELFDLETLAEKCKAVGRTSFFLSSMPLKVKGGVASPPNAVAVF